MTTVKTEKHGRAERGEITGRRFTAPCPCHCHCRHPRFSPFGIAGKKRAVAVATALGSDRGSLDDDVIFASFDRFLCLFDLVAEEERDDEVADSVYHERDSGEHHDRVKGAKGNDTAEHDRDRREEKQPEPTLDMCFGTIDTVHHGRGTVCDDEDTEEHGQDPLDQLGVNEEEQTREKEGDAHNQAGSAEEKSAGNKGGDGEDTDHDEQDACDGSEDICGGGGQSNEEDSHDDREHRGENAVPFASAEGFFEFVHFFDSFPKKFFVSAIIIDFFYRRFNEIFLHNL